MGGEIMSFPATVEEFMEQHKMVDKEKIYSNGTEYVPIFRMKQWLEHLKQMPSAQPERWIPVTESLPKNDDWCIVTILYERGDSPLRYTDFGWYLEEANCWIVGAEQQWTGVVAWMPLPEPWRGEEDETDS